VCPFQRNVSGSSIAVFSIARQWAEKLRAKKSSRHDHTIHLSRMRRAKLTQHSAKFRSGAAVDIRRAGKGQGARGESQHVLVRNNLIRPSGPALHHLLGRRVRNVSRCRGVFCNRPGAGYGSTQRKIPNLVTLVNVGYAGGGQPSTILCEELMAPRHAISFTTAEKLARTYFRVAGSKIFATKSRIRCIPFFVWLDPARVDLRSWSAFAM